MKVLTLPNKISLGRIFFIPPFAFCIIQVQHSNQYRYVCLFFMLIIGLSDVLDGYIARKRNERTTLGKLLDPVADKLALATSCIILSSEGLWQGPRLPDWYPKIIIGTYILLILGTIAMYLITGITACQPSTVGKVSACLQSLVIITVLIGNHIPASVLTAIWKSTVIVTIASGVFYLYRGGKTILLSVT
ncbi:MAG: CDP-alcohol phosphatidyltransferase family protein [Candidatus Brocadiaceae bacterium]|nr:CDP-alcohol phosphatidyltransferase family protein [Candidatus Brocadiaceae bacterium]